MRLTPVTWATVVVAGSLGCMEEIAQALPSMSIGIEVDTGAYQLVEWYVPVEVISTKNGPDGLPPVEASASALSKGMTMPVKSTCSPARRTTIPTATTATLLEVIAQEVEKLASRVCALSERVDRLQVRDGVQHPGCPVVSK